MISLNIKKDSKIQTKSFVSYRELVMFLKTLPLYGVVKIENPLSDKSQVLLGLPIEYKLADKLWNLQVSQSLKHSGFVFSVRTKQRQTNPVSGVLEWR
jgi:hypothetical protein